MVVGLLEVLKKFRMGWVGWGGGLFNYSVTPVQSLTVDFGVWTLELDSGVGLDFDWTFA